MSEDNAAIQRLIERLRRTRKEVRMSSLFGGAVIIPDEEQTREAPINPDGPAAADLIERLLAHRPSNPGRP